jgi:hypothetical protein
VGTHLGAGAPLPLSPSGWYAPSCREDAHPLTVCGPRYPMGTHPGTPHMRCYTPSAGGVCYLRSVHTKPQHCARTCVVSEHLAGVLTGHRTRDLVLRPWCQGVRTHHQVLKCASLACGLGCAHPEGALGGSPSGALHPPVVWCAMGRHSCSMCVHCVHTYCASTCTESSRGTTPGWGGETLYYWSMHSYSAHPVYTGYALLQHMHHIPAGCGHPHIPPLEGCVRACALLQEVCA